MYSLTASDTKKIVIGIEYDRESDDFKPCLRFYGGKGLCFLFDTRSWQSLKVEVLESLAYLSSTRPAEADKVVEGVGFLVRYTSFFQEKAIEIEANNSSTEAKKFKLNFALQLRSVENLIRIMPCIDGYIERLQFICGHISLFIDLLAKEIGESDDIKNKDFRFMCVRDLHRLKFEINKKMIEKCMQDIPGYSPGEIEYLLQCILVLKPEYVCQKINELRDAKS